MKVVALMLMCLVAGCAAQCNTLQRLLVKKEWSSLFGSGMNREALGTRIFKQLYKVKPETPTFFQDVSGDDIYSSKFIAHSQRVLGGLDTCIALLDDQETLDEQLAHLQKAHILREITADYFDAFNDVILDIMPEYMGSSFHNLKSWVECLDVIKTGIKSL